MISIATQALRRTLGLLLLLACAPALAATSTLIPIADAYVRAGTYASTNFGSATTLTIGISGSTNNNYDSYLKFDSTNITRPVTGTRSGSVQ